MKTLNRKGRLHYSPSYVNKQYSDIFSYSVKEKAMDVPPMEFTTKCGKETKRATLMHFSTEKRDALKVLLDNLTFKFTFGHRDLRLIDPVAFSLFSPSNLLLFCSGGVTNHGI